MKQKNRSGELKITDVDIGDLLLVRTDSRNYPVPVYNEHMKGNIFKWGDTGEDNCRDYPLLYVGKARCNRFLYHKFLHGEETYYIRGHHIRYLRKA